VHKFFVLGKKFLAHLMLSNQVCEPPPRVVLFYQSVEVHVRWHIDIQSVDKLVAQVACNVARSDHHMHI